MMNAVDLRVEHIRIGVFVLRGVVYGLECNFVRPESMLVFFLFFSLCLCVLGVFMASSRFMHDILGW